MKARLPVAVSRWEKKLLVLLDDLNWMSFRELKVAAMEHSKKNGLTTWMYLQDPVDDQLMVNVVENHSFFLGSPNSTIRQALEQAEEFDDFDHENSKALTTYSFYSLSPEIQSHLNLLVKPEEKGLFICVWIGVLYKVLKVSSSYYDKLKARVKQVKPNAFSHKNIKEWYKALLPDLDELL